MESTQVMDKSNEGAQAFNQMPETAKHKLSEFSDRVMESSKSAASSTDAYIREYAWSSLALAAMLGIVLGLIIRRS